MRALVLEKKGVLSVRDIDIKEEMGPDDVRIAMHTVGVCGSDVHFYEFGRIGPFFVREPMVLGHEASGVVIEAGGNVQHLKPGDRVCIEPGIPDWKSRASRQGMYNLDRGVKFWAAPPTHGCLRETVVHPAILTYKLPENVTPAEGAMVEPLAVALHAVNKLGAHPGDVAVVLGAGTIGLMACASALAGGCSRVIVVDCLAPKLELAAKLGAVTPVNFKEQNPLDVVREMTGGWGADLVFECSGNPEAVASTLDLVCPGGKIAFTGCPVDAAPIQIVKAQTKEATMIATFRYAHVYPRALALLAAGKIDVKPFITDLYDFDHSVEAFDYALHPKPTSVKVQIVMGAQLAG